MEPIDEIAYIRGGKINIVYFTDSLIQIVKFFEALCNNQLVEKRSGEYVCLQSGDIMIWGVSLNDFSRVDILPPINYFVDDSESQNTDYSQAVKEIISMRFSENVKYISRYELIELLKKELEQ
jgi:hypothetical protein